jgi:predicted alpha/beta-fold hydrolase
MNILLRKLHQKVKTVPDKPRPAFDSAESTAAAVLTSLIVCPGLPLTGPKCYSAAFTDDAHVGVETVQRRFPEAPLFAAGYSLGSLILTKYLAEADTGKWTNQGAGLSLLWLITREGNSDVMRSPD